MFVITVSFADNFGNSEYLIEDKVSFPESDMHYFHDTIAEECSVTASGTVEMANGGSFTASITVSGPCDASLANKLRSAIKGLRDSFK